MIRTELTPHSPPFQGGEAATFNKDVAKPPLSGAAGVVFQESRSAPHFVEVPNHPGCAAKEGNRLISAQPPLLGKEGNS